MHNNCTYLKLRDPFSLPIRCPLKILLVLRLRPCAQLPGALCAFCFRRLTTGSIYEHLRHLQVELYARAIPPASLQFRLPVLRPLLFRHLSYLRRKQYTYVSSISGLLGGLMGVL